jgi:hypothetical protein
MMSLHRTANFPPAPTIFCDVFDFKRKRWSPESSPGRAGSLQSVLRSSAAYLLSSDVIYQIKKGIGVI